MKDWLKNKGTDANIRDQLMCSLWTWNSPEAMHTDWDHLIFLARKIGKQHIWDGWISIEW